MVWAGKGASEREFVVTAAFGFLLGVIVAWVSLTLTFETRGDTLYNLLALVDGRALRFGDELQTSSSFHNNLMLGTVHGAISRSMTFLSPTQWYLLLRMVTFGFALSGFLLAARYYLKLEVRQAKLATSLLAIAAISTFNFPWEHPTDAIDIGIQALGAMLALRGRFATCLLLAAVFSVNRDSAAMLGISWFVLAPDRPVPRRALEAVVISAASIAVVVALRHLVGHAQDTGYALALMENGAALVDAVTHLQPVNWLVIAAAVVIIFLCNIEFANRLSQKCAVLALVLAIPELLFYRLAETRVLLPSYVMLALAVAAARGTIQESDKPSRGTILD